MSRLTTDSADPNLHRGFDKEEVSQASVYLVLSKEEREKGFIRPYRDSYYHTACGVVTKMSREIAETYARNPSFYGGTYCVGCRKHLPLAEFRWLNPEGIVTSEILGD